MSFKVNNLQETGVILRGICKRLANNEELVKLMCNTDKDPSGHSAEVPPEVLFQDYIKVLPVVTVQPEKEEHPIIVVRAPVGNLDNENSDFLNIRIVIELVVPFSQWAIKGENLRPYAIMSEIMKTLNGINLNGIGRLSLYTGFSNDNNSSENSFWSIVYKIAEFK